MQLLGMAPFTGISIGVDRGSPVDWDLYERHGSYPYRGELAWVEYRAGPKASYNPELIVAIEREVAGIYD